MMKNDRDGAVLLTDKEKYTKDVEVAPAKNLPRWMVVNATVVPQYAPWGGATVQGQLMEPVSTLQNNKVKEDQAAARIQSQVRGREARATLKEQNAAAVKIQAQIRGKQARAQQQQQVAVQATIQATVVPSVMTSASAAVVPVTVTKIYPTTGMPKSF